MMELNGLLRNIVLGIKDMEKLTTCAVSVPHTRRHITFLNEITEVLKALEVPYEARVEEDYTGQESWVRFFTNDSKEVLLGAIVEAVSTRVRDKKSLDDVIKEFK